MAPGIGSRALALLAVLVLLAGLVRGGVVVVLEPLAGYGNQYDMLRSSACLGLWPEGVDPPSRATPAAPVPRYVQGAKDPANCLPGSEAVLAGLAMALATPFVDDTMSLRWVGSLKWVLFALGALLFHALLRAHPGAALAHAAVAAVVLADPFNVLFVNTLYTEIPALLGAYLAIGALGVAGVRGDFPKSLWVPWLAGLALLGGSRVQHLLLPMALLAPAAFVLGGRRLAPWGASAVVALLALAFQVSVMQRSEHISDANVVNTVFFTVLPAGGAPARMADELGLSPACAELAHTSWFLRRGQDHRGQCPEAFGLSRLRLAAVLAGEPATGLRLALRALHASGAWRLPYSGEVAGQDFGRLEPPLGGGLAKWVARVPFPVYAAFWVLPIWLAAWALWCLGSGRAAPGSSLRGLCVVQVALGAVVALTFASALLGDGFSEFSRHVHLGHNAVAVAWLLFLPLLVLAWREGARPGGALLGGCLFLGGALAFAAERLPLSSGLLDQPAGLQIEAKPLTVSGWAVDPAGVSEVRLEIDGLESRAMTLSASPVHAGFYPVGAAPVVFSQALPLGEAAAGRELRLVVVNRRGEASVVDRRRVAPLP